MSKSDVPITIHIHPSDDEIEDPVYVPTEAIHDPRLTITDKGIFGVFCSEARVKPSVSDEKLLRILSRHPEEMTHNEMMASLTRLSDAGYIEPQPDSNAHELRSEYRHQ